MAFIKVGDLLTIRRYGTASSQPLVDAMAILGAWPAILKELRLTEKFARVEPLAFRDGRLTVRAASAPLVSELKMTESRIIGAYERRFKTSVLNKILIRR